MDAKSYSRGADTFIPRGELQCKGRRWSIRAAGVTLPGPAGSAHDAAAETRAAPLMSRAAATARGDKPNWDIV